MNKSNNFFRGTLLGLAVGLIGGVLLAPKSGRETQADIKRRAKGIIGDASQRADQLQNQLGDRVERLKAAAKDLGEEAREESQGLIARAELMKQDLRTSTKSLGNAGRGAKDETMASISQMMDHGATLMNELESATKRLVRSAKGKLRSQSADNQAALARIEELEQNGRDSSDEALA